MQSQREELTALLAVVTARRDEIEKEREEYARELASIRQLMRQVDKIIQKIESYKSLPSVVMLGKI